MSSYRHEWYQTDGKIVISVLAKDAESKNLKIAIERELLLVTIDDFKLELELHRPINSSSSKYKVTSSKIEITLVKEKPEQWEGLVRKVKPVITSAPPPIHKKNWDSLAKEVEKKDEEEAQSEAALQQLFQKIYSKSSPEVRKAMNKSFSESGGTVLSTNWDEVGTQKVEVKPPEGVEFRKWEA